MQKIIVFQGGTMAYAMTCPRKNAITSILQQLFLLPGHSLFVWGLLDINCHTNKTINTQFG